MIDTNVLLFSFGIIIMFICVLPLWSIGAIMVVISAIGFLIGDNMVFNLTWFLGSIMMIIPLILHISKLRRDEE